jgi:hypothetical protein
VLTAENAPRLGKLAAEKLDSQSLSVRVTSVSTRALSFFVGHETVFLKPADQRGAATAKDDSPPSGIELD